MADNADVKYLGNQQLKIWPWKTWFWVIQLYALRHQAIVYTKHEPVHWRKYAPASLNELCLPFGIVTNFWVGVIFFRCRQPFCRPQWYMPLFWKKRTHTSSYQYIDSRTLSIYISCGMRCCRHAFWLYITDSSLICIMLISTATLDPACVLWRAMLVKAREFVFKVDAIPTSKIHKLFVINPHSMETLPRYTF